MTYLILVNCLLIFITSISDFNTISQNLLTSVLIHKTIEPWYSLQDYPMDQWIDFGTLNLMYFCLLCCWCSLVVKLDPLHRRFSCLTLFETAFFLLCVLLLGRISGACYSFFIVSSTNMVLISMLRMDERRIARMDNIFARNVVTYSQNNVLFFVVATAVI